jgi:predicted MFS family arabinose efflux permease
MPTAALFALIVAVQFVQAPFMAAQAAVLPVVLGGEAYQAGQALRQITRQVGTLVGLACGGIAVATLGVSTALAIDAMTFVLAAAVIRIGTVHRVVAATARERGGPGLRQGAALIWRDPVLRSLVGLTWLAGFAVVPEALMVPFAISVGAGAAAVGWLLAVEAAAMVAGAFLLVQFVPMQARLRLLGPLAILTVVPLIGYAARPGLVTALILLALSGACAAYQVTASATFLERVPDARRGQAYGVARSGLIAVQGLGVLTGGILAELTGSVTTTIALAGITGTLAAAFAAMSWRRAQTGHHTPHRPTPIPIAAHRP